MSKLATFVVALGALVLAFVTLSPNSAEAGWRRWGWAARASTSMSARATAGMAPATTTGLMPITVIPTAIIPIGAAATGAAGTRHERLRAHVCDLGKGRSREGVALIVCGARSMNGG